MTLSKDDFSEISKIIKNELDPLKNDLSTVKKDLKGVKKSITKIDDNVEDILGFLDAQDVKLEKRVKRIEEHLNLPQN